MKKVADIAPPTAKIRLCKTPSLGFKTVIEDKDGIEKH